eukprot:5943466-Alexandrium_andersonii.AAC.1
MHWKRLVERPSETPRSLQNCPFRRHIRNQREQRRRMHPSRASGINLEAAPGPEQFERVMH